MYSFLMIYDLWFMIIDSRKNNYEQYNDNLDLYRLRIDSRKRKTLFNVTSNKSHGNGIIINSYYYS